MRSSKFPYLNDYDPKHFQTPRQYDRDWNPDDGPNWDAVVVGAVLVLASGTFLLLALYELL